MQIYITQSYQQFVISPKCSAIFKQNALIVYHENDFTKYVAKIGDTFIIKTNNDVTTAVKVHIPKNYAQKIALTLSFSEDKICSSLEEFFERVDERKANYKSKAFRIESHPQHFAFLVAKKPDRRFFAPLLIWVNEDITEEELTEMFKLYRKYRKIYFPEAFYKIILKR